MSSDFLLGVPSRVKTLIDRLTATRAGYLDNLTALDAALSGRAAGTDMATVLSRLSSTRAGYLDNLGNSKLLAPPNGFFSGLSHPVRTGLESACGGMQYLSQSVNGDDSLTTIGSALTGPGIISYLNLCISSFISGTVNIDYEVDVDSTTVLSGNFDVTADGDGVNLIGCISGDSTNGYAMLEEPLYFGTSFEVKVSQNQGNGTYDTLIAYMVHRQI